MIESAAMLRFQLSFLSFERVAVAILDQLLWFSYKLAIQIYRCRS